MEKRFISIDGKEPVNINHLITVFKRGPLPGVAPKFSIVFIYPKNGYTVLWSYGNQKERDKAYNFLAKKIAVCYSSESVIERFKEHAKKAIRDKIKNLLSKRHMQFNVIEHKKPLLINHENIKAANFDDVKYSGAEFVAKPKRRNKTINKLLQSLTNYYG